MCCIPSDLTHALNFQEITWTPRDVRHTTPPPANHKTSKMSGKRAKKKPVFWDRDGVNEGKSSLQVVLDWLSTETNYNEWQGSDRNSGNTEEALLKEIVAELRATGDPAPHDSGRP
ncbi:hypothetical protein PR003_g25921 [Phytophthora rubi]|uniref:Uncharacterized protein n=1 Tax=Phytophthora rubi TaxID=129364 RepID=A0A6A3HH87_9STRA|nr:hypothetical protein PR002_g27413 [Phytophthora rubi]KAE9287976.1 hypothetical protein PR003_g25921 [Phytophthora rubi]